MTPPSSSPEQRRALNRRGFLGLAVGGAAGAAAAVAIPAVSTSRAEAGSSDPASVYPFYGQHQSGISTPAQAHATVVAFRLLPSADRAALGRLMRTWTDTSAALMAGRPAPADPAPELAIGGAGLTITLGVGPRALRVAQEGPPSPNLDIPAFSIDELEPKWSGGDLVAQICAHDATTVHHALRMLARDAAPFATVLWRQTGFNGARPSGPTRNLLGQVEGTGNPIPDSSVFDETVWATEGPAWFVGGTTMVVRRIRLALDRWDTLPPVERDKVLGRRTEDGAPRGQASISDPLDFDLLDTQGPTTHVHGDDSAHVHDDQPVGLAIPENSHVRRAHPSFNQNRRIMRRGYSYADAPGDEGLVFIAFQRDLDAYVEIQRSLDAVDALNDWSTPIGSAAFAMLPGCERGDWLGRELLDT